MRKGGINWVDGEDFFGREVELKALEDRMHEGIHTLLTAQRRMGKTSLVRELQRRLVEKGQLEVVFVDLEAAIDPADAIAEISVRTKPVDTAWKAIVNSMRSISDRIEELSVADLKVKLRARIDAGNWRQRGDAIFTALAEGDRSVVLAIDELPILVNRLLRDEEGCITPGGKQEVDAFLSWLRKAGQSHRGRVTLILSGSVGLQPLLEQAGLIAHANILSPYDLKPWSRETAVSCLEELAGSYGIGLAPEVCRDMCRRLRCCIPHHVQMFFDRMHQHLQRTGRENASLEDVERVYVQDMQGVSGQVDLQHYENRLEPVLGRAGYAIALEILTATAAAGGITAETIDRYRDWFSTQELPRGDGTLSVNDVLHVLLHDGYLEPEDGSYRFVSGLIEEWWDRRYGQGFIPAFDR